MTSVEPVRGQGDRPGGPVPYLTVTGLAKTFSGVRVVDGVDLAFSAGQIHALIGGNGSGKSTVLKMLAGVYTPDPGGVITIDGVSHDTAAYGPHVAGAEGLRFVHQDLGLVEDLTVAENFALVMGFPRRWMGVDWGRLERETARALRSVGLEHGPRTLVRDLSASDRTLVAVARALQDAHEGRRLVLVLDEPTASLPHAEVDRLLAALRRCRNDGHTIIYVSHHLPEVLAIADVVSVLRDGRLVATGAASEFDERSIVGLLSAGAEDRPHPAPPSAARMAAEPVGVPVLALVGFRTGPVEVDLEVAAGEIVGVAGLLGSGRSALLRGVFGDLAATGDMRLSGRRVEIRSPREAVAHGIGLVPEDRRRDALFADRSVALNVTAAGIEDYRVRGRLDHRRERQDAQALLRAYGVRTASPETPIGQLSGGNQQKAVLARWMRRQPRLLLLDEPSQGVDVVARAEIHAAVRAHAARGAGVLVVSSDYEELQSVCDRVVVLRNGRLVAQLTGPDLTVHSINEITQVDEGRRSA